MSLIDQVRLSRQPRRVSPWRQFRENLAEEVRSALAYAGIRLRILLERQRKPRMPPADGTQLRTVVGPSVSVTIKDTPGRALGFFCRAGDGASLRVYDSAVPDSAHIVISLPSLRAGRFYALPQHDTREGASGISVSIGGRVATVADFFYI